MKILKIAISLVVVLNSAMAFSAEKQNPTTIISEFQHSIESNALQRSTDIVVRLPANYAESNIDYPVIYLLNASSFYYGDIGLDSIYKIEQLQKQNGIPKSILVLVNSDQWYADVINHADKFEQYLNQDLMKFINQEYRTLNNSTLIGHSYTGAFVSRLATSDSNQFDFLLAISPIYPNVDYVTDIQNNIQSMKISESILHIIQGDEDYTFVNMVNNSLENTAKKKFDMIQDKIKYEEHHSIVSIGLSFGLRHYFRDFRIPADTNVLKNQYSYALIQQYFAKRDKKYQLEVTDHELQSAVTSIASVYLSAKKSSLSFPLWKLSKSKFKGYFMNTIAERFLAIGDSEYAITIWKEMTQLLPDKSGSHAGLAKGYVSINKINKAISAYTKAVELAKKNEHPKLELYKASLENLLHKE